MESNGGCKAEWIIRYELKWYPDQIRLGHELTESDLRRQLDFVHWSFRTCQNKKFLHNAVIGYKACFSMNCPFNLL